VARDTSDLTPANRLRVETADASNRDELLRLAKGHDAIAASLSTRVKAERKRTSRRSTLCSTQRRKRTSTGLLLWEGLGVSRWTKTPSCSIRQTFRKNFGRRPRQGVKPAIGLGKAMPTEPFSVPRS